MVDPIRTSSRRVLAAQPAEDTILSVKRAFHIVEMLADQAEGLSLADISRRLEVNKAIAVKLLDTLEQLGFIWRDDVAQRYQLTYRISNLGLRQLQQSRLLDQCAAILKNLAEATGELVRLAVVENAERITWVYAVAGATRSVRIDPNYTLEIILNAHAIAKAWLSTLPFERAWELIERQGISACTIHTKTTREALRSDLEEAARRGFATSYEEQEIGVGAIAAPIVIPNLDGARECVGAVSLAAPTSRMSRSEIEACAPMLIETVARLARAWPLERRTLRPIVRRL
ncbi:MAG TPA: IclR family transcriptional regulator [Alphaproteobacteria bacterium]